jgi:maltose alpha-D-glucosyltransferase/alpha-amylase
LGWYFENVLAQRPEIEHLDTPAALVFEPMDSLPPECFEWLGTYCDSARLMGQRTAQLHLYLASDTETPQFKPERFTKLYQRSLYQSMRTLARITLTMLRKHASEFPEARRRDIQIVLELEKDIQERFRSLLSRKISAMRIRCHGDYHLGQVLYTGKDFIMIDFEGEPARPISQRRIKRSPVRDVAGMLRSLHYAAYTALSAQAEKGLAEKSDRIFLETCAHYWYRWAASIFLRAYIDTAGQGRFLPQTQEEFRVLLDAFLLEKVIYELAYEMNNRPDWIQIPLRGIIELMQGVD